MRTKILFLVVLLFLVPAQAAEDGDGAADAAAREQSERFFGRFDRNEDGRLTLEEFPERGRRMFPRIDANGDGVVTVEEDLAFRKARASGAAARGRRPRLPDPDHANVSYGDHERNVLDLWLGKGDGPKPLVIYYHGGGFRGGDKRSLSPALLATLLEGGVSVAAANYRLTDVAPFPAPMHDCARALQFLRAHAKEYRIDPDRVGATGGSAGAGISLWLAFHADLADPENEDPVARQSTRLSAAVVYAAQSSYDPRFIRKLFGTTEMHGALLPFYGMTDLEDIDDPKFQALFEEASPITHATKDDAPVMLFYPQANEPLVPGSSGQKHIHHPKFGFVLKEKLDALGVECVLLLREDHPKGTPTGKYATFFFEKLGAGKAKEPGSEDQKPTGD